jgi:hypothetical protein
MPYVPFHDHFPETAKRETRTITLLPSSKLGMPAGEYAFLEMFCDEPRCDCRRVFFCVVSSLCKDVEAVIAYGWENPNFYIKWMKDDDPYTIAELKGPILNLGSPQSRLAPDILTLVRNVLLKDAQYVERVKRHYRMFREKIDGVKQTKGIKKA